MSGILFIISAPSGSGKTTLVNELLTRIPCLEFSISYTTRAPRGSERDGREYFFVGRESFEQMIRRGEFLEYADVFGNYYGTARSALEEATRRGNDLLLDIDVQGAKQIKQALPDAVTIFILPPNKETLEKRLRARSQDQEPVIQRRLQEATKEIENWTNYDYILVNDQLDQSIDTLQAIVWSERAKRKVPVSAEQTRSSVLAEACLQANVRERLRPILVSFHLSAAPSGR